MLHLDAGRYAMFVWPAYAATAIAFIGMTWGCLAYARRQRRRAERLEQR